jgi:hypothetical protein
MDCCGIQPLPPVNAQAPPPETLTKIPAGSLASQVVAYNALLAFVNSQTNSAWFDLFDQLTISSSTYSSAKATLDALVASASDTLTGARILMISPDGRVFYDSSKGTTNSFSNIPGQWNGYVATSSGGAVTTKLNTGDGNINGNHGMRPDVISSLIFNPTGYGYTTYESTSTGDYSAYVSKRIGAQGIANSFIAPGVIVRVVTTITL